MDKNTNINSECVLEAVLYCSKVPQGEDNGLTWDWETWKQRADVPQSGRMTMRRMRLRWSEDEKKKFCTLLWKKKSGLSNMDRSFLNNNKQRLSVSYKQWCDSSLLWTFIKLMLMPHFTTSNFYHITIIRKKTILHANTNTTGSGGIAL